MTSYFGLEKKKCNVMKRASELLNTLKGFIQSRISALRVFLRLDSAVPEASTEKESESIPPILQKRKGKRSSKEMSIGGECSQKAHQSQIK